MSKKTKKTLKTLKTLRTQTASAIARFEQTCVHRDDSTTAIAEKCAAEITGIEVSLLAVYPSSSLSDKITILGLLSRIGSLASSPDYTFIEREIAGLRTLPSLTLPQRAALAVMSESATDAELHSYLTALTEQLREADTPDPAATEAIEAITVTLGIN